MKRVENDEITQLREENAQLKESLRLIRTGLVVLEKDCTASHEKVRISTVERKNWWSKLNIKVEDEDVSS